MNDDPMTSVTDYDRDERRALDYYAPEPTHPERCRCRECAFEEYRA